MELAETAPSQLGPAVEPSAGDTPHRICLITLGGELFAVDLRHVREVFEVESVTPVPGMPSTLTGVANLRGTVMPLADLRPVLGLPASGPRPKYAVVVQYDAQQVAVLVDQVPEIRTIRAGEMLEASTRGTKGVRPFVSTIVKVDERMSGFIEIRTLLACVEAGEGH
ncbi:MAG TPA: chemotaxis protein CheW [Nitrospiraceae bacterium]|jgi:purine-binding chemotaxis protein CheW|nr:chemotaxis protein CheW [Nitrospiraceae bacterium]